MISQSLLLSIAASFVFRKLPVDLTQHLLSLTGVLDVMNTYTEQRYGEKFWDGRMVPDAFNKNYRLVCPPTSFDFIPRRPFVVKTVFLERTPFTEGQDYAKFAVHRTFTEPLLVK